MLGIGVKRLEQLQGHRRLVRMEGGPPGTQTLQPATAMRSMLPHNVTIAERRRPAFWNPTAHYKRIEFLVEPPLLPGTAIPYTLFHPTYIPGLQGFKDYLPWNFAWAWGRNNFERFGALLARLRDEAPSYQSTTRRAAVWKPAMQSQPFLNGQVWDQPRPWYMPLVINPPRPTGSGGSRSNEQRGRRG